jgi:hypothetical protein
VIQCFRAQVGGVRSAAPRACRPVAGGTCQGTATRCDAVQGDALLGGNHQAWVLSVTHTAVRKPLGVTETSKQAV